MNSVSAVTDQDQVQGQEPALVTLRGTAQGLEVLIDSAATAVDELTDKLRTQLAKAPDFFRGEDVVLRFRGTPPAGCLGPMEAAAREFGLHVVAVRSDAEEKRKAARAALSAVAELEQAEPGGPAVASAEPTAEPTEAIEDLAPSEPVDVSELVPVGQPPTHDAIAGGQRSAAATRMIVGPVRSGGVLEVTGDITIVGDVNPGAEVRAGGSIVVLGALRGVAHAGRRDGRGFILALRLAPQQLRIGALVARAADADQPDDRPEIAHAKDGRIIVEAYQGRLPGK
jgi:septum site-determining protein MinC